MRGVPGDFAFGLFWLVMATGTAPLLRGASTVPPGRPLSITVVAERPADCDASLDATGAEVGKPLASVMRAVPGAVCVETTCTRNRCIAVVHFGSGAALLEKMKSVSQGLSLSADKLPAGWVVSGIFPDSVPRIFVALSSERLTLVELTKIADRLGRNHYERLPGVMNVQVIGGAKESSVLTLNPAKMAGFGISVEDVRSALHDVRLSTAGAPNRAAAPPPGGWGTVTIKTVNGVPIRLSDVASSSRQIQRAGSGSAGEHAAIVLAIWAAPTEPPTQTTKPQLAQIAGELPATVRLDVADLSGEKAALVEIAPPADLSEAAHLDWQRRVIQSISAAAGGAVCIGCSSPDDVEPAFRVLITRDDGAIDLGNIRKNLVQVPHERAWTGTLDEQSAPLPTHIALLGPDTDILKRWADATSARIKSSRAAEDIHVFPAAGSVAVKFEVDKAAAAKLAISADAIDQALMAIAGTPVTLPDGQTAVLKWPGAGMDALGWLDVKSATGDVPITAVVRRVSEPAPSAIYRVDQSPALRITAYPPAGSSSELAASKCLQAANDVRIEMKLPKDFHAVSLSQPMH